MSRRRKGNVSSGGQVLEAAAAVSGRKPCLAATPGRWLSCC